MSQAATSTTSRRPQRLRRPDPTVQEIIAKGRSVRPKARGRGAWLLSGASALLLWAAFLPLNWAPLAWIALVPLVVLIRLPRPTRWMYTGISLGGLGFFVAALQWMRLGHPTMYPAWIALAAYCAVYIPLFVGLSRVAVHRLRAPLILAVPLVWVGLEFLRGWLMSGFAWYYLAHTQYRWIELIQISDLVGAYGVSFIVAMSSACLALFVPQSVFERLQLLADKSHGLHPVGTGTRIISVAVCLAVFAGALIYGYARRAQADFREGPRVALIQGNFPTSVESGPDEALRIFRRHRWLTGLAVQHQPDLVVWPETMYREPLVDLPPEISDEDLRRTTGADPRRVRTLAERVPQNLADRAKEAGAAMVLGIETRAVEDQQVKRYNSAVFVRPDVGLTDRYDKMHRVPFGEYIPLKNTLPWLQRLTPFSWEFGIEAGAGVSVFDYRGWQFSPVICFEDTVPHLVRNIVKSANQHLNGKGQQPGDAAKPESEIRNPKSLDCLINLTNDGWFSGSSEPDQHLITAAFRSVECRTPMVRAVNTGISAVVDGDGVVVEPDVFIDGDDKGRSSMRDPETGRWRKNLDAVLVDSIPLDDRQSLYVRWGDWFAGACAFCCFGLLLIGLIPDRNLARRDDTPGPNNG